MIKSKSFQKKIRNLNNESVLFTTALPYENSSSSEIKDQQSFDKIKQKQMAELQSIIDYEFSLEDIRENNQKKLELQKEKEEKIKAEKVQKANEDSYKRKLKELEKQKKGREDDEVLVIKQKKREKLEKIKQNDERKKKEEKDEDLKTKILEQNLKNLGFKKQVEDNLVVHQSFLFERKKMLENKDQVRKEMLEQKKTFITKQSKLKSIINEQKLTNTMDRLDKKLAQQVYVLDSIKVGL